MKKFLRVKPLPDLMAVAWFIMRLVVAYLMIFGHGLGKLQHVLAGEMSFADPLGLGEAPSLVLAVFAEFLCSLFVAAGLFTRFATVPLIITMLVALFITHASDPISDNWNIIGYLVVYFLLLYSGPGKFSLDYRYWPRQ